MKMDRKISNFFSTVQTGVVTDAMNVLGLKGWMRDIFPLRPEARIFGPSFTVQASFITGDNTAQKNYSVYELSELWKPGDVMLIDGMNTHCALMGENMAHRCQYEGLAGLVLNGRCRDFAEIRDLKMPVFGRGPAMHLKNGILAFSHYNVPINMAGTHVNPGDYVLGDIDGILVFPSDKAEKIMELSIMIMGIEEEMENAIRERKPTAKIKEIVLKKARLE